jgi:hypothetical protein
LDMSRIRPECSDTYPPDGSVAAEALLRQDPDEQQDEEDEEDEQDDDNEKDDDEGYSE